MAERCPGFALPVHAKNFFSRLSLTCWQAGITGRNLSFRASLSAGFFYRALTVDFTCGSHTVVVLPFFYSRDFHETCFLKG